MAEYNGMILTKAGLTLQAQTQIGGELRITKIAIGDGILAAGESIEDLTALKSLKMTLGIQDMQALNGQSRIRALISNENLDTGFFVREVGVFARIGDSGTETLYSYTNAADKADYLPNKGINIVEELLEIYVIVGNAQNVTCIIDDHVTVATKQDVMEHTSNTNNPHNVIASQVPNDLIKGLNTTDVQSTLQAVYAESMKKGNSGAARNVAVTGPVNLLRDRYGSNLCIGGTPISGGDYTGYPAENGFDGNDYTLWSSVQQNTAVANAAYLGYMFPAAKHIRKVIINNHNDPLNNPGAAKIQNSTDGNTWSDIQAITLVVGRNVIELPASQAAAYWRVLATANTTTTRSFGIYELAMYEILNPESKNSDLIIQEGALVTFAAGFDISKKQAVDYWEVTQQIPLALEASDGYTVPFSHTENLCNSGNGTAISSGNSDTSIASNAFDNNLTTWWRSLQAYNAVNGVGYIGWDFGVGAAKAIRKILFTQVATEYVNSVKVQYSDNGTTWNDACVQSVLGVSGGLVNLINVPAVGVHRYWRVLANSNAQNSSNNWVVVEIKMYEALQTHYVYLTRDANGRVTVGSTRNKPRTVKSVSSGAIKAQGYYTTDLCNGGTAIGDNNASSNAFAFDNNTGTNYASSVNTANQNGYSYIGYDFGAGITKHILRFTLLNFSNTNNNISSVKLQRSSDGVAWTDVITAPLVTMPGAINVVDVPKSMPCRFWRLLANANVTSGYVWGVVELEMMEYVELPTSSVSTDDTMYSDNLCVGGAAICGGDMATQAKELAFDGDPTTYWQSSQMYTAVSGVAAIGYDFGVARHIRKITMNQYAGLNYNVTSVKVQRSADGVGWNDVLTQAVTQDATIILPASNASRFWRLLANSNTAASCPWDVYNITMHEISNDINLYDPILGVSKHYNGSTWDNVVRVFVGEAVTDSTGNIVSCLSYQYNKTRLKALPAEDIDEVVTLGQLDIYTSKVAVLTGTIANGGTIPLPSGYTQDQCKWTVSANHIYDSQGGQWTDCFADVNRLVKLTAGTANYMIIGVK